MEFWLTFNNGQEKLQLPVPPPDYEIQTGNNNTVVNINDIGEVNLIGKRKLKPIVLNSFFPNHDYPFCQYRGFPKPYECVKLIEKWIDSGKPIRLIVTNTSINHAMAIEEFNYGERDGSGDVYFSLSLKEYRFLEANFVMPTAVASISTDVPNMPSAPVRPTEKQPPTTYVVKKGDNLWNIAKRLTGNGANCQSIAKKNGIKNPNRIYPGQKLVI